MAKDNYHHTHSPCGNEAITNGGNGRNGVFAVSSIANNLDVIFPTPQWVGSHDKLPLRQKNAPADSIRVPPYPISNRSLFQTQPRSMALGCQLIPSSFSHKKAFQITQIDRLGRSSLPLKRHLTGQSQFNIRWTPRFQPPLSRSPTAPFNLLPSPDPTGYLPARPVQIFPGVPLLLPLITPPPITGLPYYMATNVSSPAPLLWLSNVHT